jgi:hypothetical protein
MQKYHRRATGGKNQDFHTAIGQAIASEVWGTTSTFGNGFPTVRAFPGPLPDGADGIEFTTDVPPTPGSSTPHEVYWKLHQASPLVEEREGGSFAAIKVKILKARYTTLKSLQPRCEWPE